jgi:hypothetical protein
VQQTFSAASLPFLVGNNAVTTEVKHQGFLVRGGINWRFWGM